MPPTAQSVTDLLVAWSNGDRAAHEQLMPLIHRELRRLANHHFRRERRDHTLQATALVNEAYLRLVDQKSPGWQNRSHFFGIASQLMRRILVDYARGRLVAKRGGDAIKLSLEEAIVLTPERPAEMVALDEALDKLAAIDRRKSQVVELRFFGGLSIDETAEVLKISANTVMRDWSTAKAWLHREITETARRS